MRIFNDRSQGGTSYREGEIEILISRYFNTDDSLGICENFTKQEKMFLNHKIIFQDYKINTDENEEIIKIGSKNNFLYIAFFQEVVDAEIRKTIENNSAFGNILNEIPDYVKINLHPLNRNEFIIRIQDLLHENNQEVIKIKESVREKFQNINIYCRETLLDGFTDVIKNTTMNDQHDIITLSCQESQKTKKVLISSIFKKKHKNLILKYKL